MLLPRNGALPRGSCGGREAASVRRLDRHDTQGGGRRRGWSRCMVGALPPQGERSGLRSHIGDVRFLRLRHVGHRNHRSHHTRVAACSERERAPWLPPSPQAVPSYAPPARARAVR